VNEQRVVGVMMTYNCARLVTRAFKNVPRHYFHEVICVDDGSTDDTVAVASKLGIPVYTHPHTGYGGNLFFGFGKALEMGATHIIELHGDGQYDFGAVPETIDRLAEGCDLILGNRFYDMRQPLRDGMDLARYLGNIFLSAIGRAGLGIPTRDLFPGFRAYSRRFVETIAIERTSKNYFFSFEIIAQARYCGLKICQVPVRCDYKGEHSSMKLSKGFPAILHTCETVFLVRLARLNMRRGIFASQRPGGERVEREPQRV
jgi:glycosyltransferase involved in cell wall biosynthesis